MPTDWNNIVDVVSILLMLAYGFGDGNVVFKTRTVNAIRAGIIYDPDTEKNLQSSVVLFRKKIKTCYDVTVFYKLYVPFARIVTQKSFFFSHSDHYM